MARYSEFWHRKIRTYVHAFDVDNDGFISEEEFGELARQLAVNENANPEQVESLVKAFVNVWRKLMKSADLEKDNRLTAEIMAESVKQQFYYPDLIIAFHELIHGFFALMDVNHDGFLQPEEHKRIFDNEGIPEETFDRRVAFDALDVDKDEKVSIDEYTNGFFDFLFSQDPKSPNKYFLRNLVD